MSQQSKPATGSTQRRTIQLAERARLAVPYSQEAEEAVIGAALINPDAFATVTDLLRPDDFYLIKHAYIWAAIEHLDRLRDTVDYLTVANRLRETKKLDQVGDTSYLLTLVNNTPTSQHVETYAEIVRRASARRKLLKAADAVRALAVDESRSLDEISADVEGEILAITQGASRRTDAPMSRVMGEFTDDVTYRIEHGGSSYLPSGYKAFDERVDGYARGELTIIGGRPNMGKSAMMQNTALRMARLGLRVVYLSTENRLNELAMRMAAIESDIDSRKFQSGALTKLEIGRFIESASRLSKLPITLDYVPQLSPRQVRARLQRFKRETGFDVIMIDGLWQMQAPDFKESNRVLELGHISQELLSFSRAYNVPLVLAHQLNRNCEGRKNKRPIMSDLEFSGALEQNADRVIFIYREAEYNRACKDPFAAEWIVAKNRNGAKGMIQVRFKAETTRFYETHEIVPDLTPRGRGVGENAKGP